MSDSMSVNTVGPVIGGRLVALRSLIGSGDKIGRFVLPFVLIGAGLGYFYPTTVGAGALPLGFRALAAIMLVAGLVVWAWSVVLILTKASRHELITTGPFALVRHPLYVGVALLVLPWLGLLLGTWLGVALGAAMYVATRLYAPREEAALSLAFGAKWDEYIAQVRMPWL